MTYHETLSQLSSPLYFNFLFKKNEDNNGTYLKFWVNIKLKLFCKLEDSARHIEHAQ